MSRSLVALVLVLSTGLAYADDRIKLSDPQLPLWELRPLDRRVYVVSLEGAWKKPATDGTTYYLALKYPDGTTITHKPINDELFRAGEMRFLIQEYQLLRHKAAKGGTITLTVVEKATRTAKPATISNSVEIAWPLKRALVRLPPATKFTPPPEDDVPPVPDLRPVPPKK